MVHERRCDLVPHHVRLRAAMEPHQRWPTAANLAMHDGIGNPDVVRCEVLEHWVHSIQHQCGGAASVGFMPRHGRSSSWGQACVSLLLNRLCHGEHDH
jgi:hypothetical protein